MAKLLNGYDKIELEYDQKMYQWSIDFTCLNPINPKIPAIVQQVLPELKSDKGEFVFCELIRQRDFPGNREYGMYTWKSVSMHWSSNLIAFATSPSFEDLAEFVRKFKAGLIPCTAPDRKEQVERPLKEAGALFREFLDLLRTSLQQRRARRLAAKSHHLNWPQFPLGPVV